MSILSQFGIGLKNVLININVGLDIYIYIFIMFAVLTCFQSQNEFDEVTMFELMMLSDETFIEYFEITLFLN